MTEGPAAQSAIKTVDVQHIFASLGDDELASIGLVRNDLPDKPIPVVKDDLEVSCSTSLPFTVPCGLATERFRTVSNHMTATTL
jgi:hypothetical protein